jgi:hypothetical protein
LEDWSSLLLGSSCCVVLAYDAELPSNWYLSAWCSISMPGMVYEEKEIVLEEGDSALFHSDGLVEAHNPQREIFGAPQPGRPVAEHDVIQPNSRFSQVG